MPRNPKLFIHGQVIFVTTRTETGLPLLSTPFMAMLIKGTLARAQELYPVVISTVLVMGNHLHMVMVVDCPQDVEGFMRYFKTESGHSINRLMGRQNGKVWEEGYDSPPVLTVSSLIEKTSYIYTNPQTENLVNYIEEYPNFSSWKVFCGGKKELSCRRIRRWYIKPLPEGLMTDREVKKYTARLKEKAKRRIVLEIDPQAAHRALAEAEADYSEFKKAVLATVREIEKNLKKFREINGKGVLGAEVLKRQSIFRAHRPKKYGQRSICICDDAELRKSYIKRYRELVSRCKEVYLKWKRGDYSVPWPAGFYPPGISPQASLLPAGFWA